MQTEELNTILQSVKFPGPDTSSFLDDIEKAGVLFDSESKFWSQLGLSDVAALFANSASQLGQAKQANTGGATNLMSSAAAAFKASPFSLYSGSAIGQLIAKIARKNRQAGIGAINFIKGDMRQVTSDPSAFFGAVCVAFFQNGILVTPDATSAYVD